MRDVKIGPVKLRLAIQGGWLRVFTKSGIPVLSMRMPVFARYFTMDDKQEITAREAPEEPQRMFPEDTRAIATMREIINRPASKDTVDSPEVKVVERNRRNFF